MIFVLAFFRKKLIQYLVTVVTRSRNTWSVTGMLSTWGSDFTLIFIIPFGLMVHNYVRIARALFKSLKENVQLKEGIKTKYVTYVTFCVGL